MVLDKQRYADIDKLIAGINKAKNTSLTINDIKQIVEKDDKQRYSIIENKIRANQGHSIREIKLDLKEAAPPNTLYHGTAEKHVDNILSLGLLKRNRNHVYLSQDTETAKKVGERHGKLAMLAIYSKKMYDDGYRFYLSENGVWLTDSVPTKYIRLVR